MVLRLGLLGALVLAFALRVYRLDAQSFWYDEGVTAFMVYRDGRAILEAASRDIHPPLYYLWIRFWSEFVGNNEFALRFSSVFDSVLSVALLARLANRLWSLQTAIFAAFFMAIAPFSIVYAQEARMYAFVTALVLASFVCFERLLESQTSPFVLSHRALSPIEGSKDSDANRRPASWPWWLAYNVLTLAALYTQYFAGLALIAQNGAALLRFGWPIRWRWWLLWVPTQLAIAALYLPWLVYAKDSLLAWPALNEPLSPLELGRQLFLVFAFGPAWDVTATPRALAAVIILAGLGLLGWDWAPPGRRARAALVGGALFVGVLAAFYVLTLQRPAYNPKFLLLAHPGFTLLLASGLTAVVGFVGLLFQLFGSRLLAIAAMSAAGVIGLGLVAYPTARALDAYYHDPKYARDDYRSLVAYIEALEQPGDVIVLNAPGQQEIFDYYYDGASPVVPLPGQRPPDRLATETALLDATKGARAVWSVEWATDQSDPDGIIRGRLGQLFALAGGRWFGSVYLATYASNARDQMTEERRLEFAEDIHGMLRFFTDSPRYKPGDFISLTFTWNAPIAFRTFTLGMRERPLSVFVHLVDDQGFPWAQHDQPFTPEGRDDRKAILVPPGTPPSEYHLVLGLYNPVSGERLQTLDGGDSVTVTAVNIERAPAMPPTTFLPQELRQVDIGSLRLIGLDVTKAGDDQHQRRFQQGETAQFTFYWQALAGDIPNGAPEILLIDGKTINAIPSPVMLGYPPAQWSDGELVRDPRRWLVHAPPGTYRLQVRWPPDFASVDLGVVTIEPAE